MTLEESRAKPNQPVRDIALLEIRPRDFISKVEQYLRETAHADPANSHKMDPPHTT